MTFVFDDAPVRLKNAKYADAETIGQTLARIAAENDGELRPQHVVEAARDKRNPLHKHFEWDDKKAADAYRLDQARAIIRIVRTQVEPDEAPVRAFYSVKDDSGQRYRAVETVMSSASLSFALVKAARKELEAFQSRYRTIRELAQPISDAMDAIDRKLKDTDQRARAA